MFDLGIEYVAVGIACPGAHRVVTVVFRDGSIGFMNSDGRCAIVAPATPPRQRRLL